MQKMAKYLRIIGLHISEKSRTFALAKKIVKFRLRKVNICLVKFFNLLIISNVL